MPNFFEPHASIVWKTTKSWSGTCRELTLRLDDGTAHRAVFAFDS
jgi:hypothetical protein